MGVSRPPGGASSGSASVDVVRVTPRCSAPADGRGGDRGRCAASVASLLMLPLPADAVVDAVPLVPLGTAEWADDSASTLPASAASAAASIMPESDWKWPENCGDILKTSDGLRMNMPSGGGWAMGENAEPRENEKKRTGEGIF